MKSVMREIYRERLEFCEDLQNIIQSERNAGLTEAEILSRLETTIEVIKTICEYKINAWQIIIYMVYYIHPIRI